MKKLVLYSLLLLLLSACQKPTIDVMGDNTVHYIKIGDGVKCDIDGDGKNDELWYSLENNKTDIKEFSINNKDFIGELEKLGVFLIDPDTLLYGLCDIDSSDDYLEIVIMDNGPSADYMSHFLRYKEGNLTYLGAVPNLLADIADNIGGDGKILSSFNLDIFQTWTAMGIYELSGDKLSFKEEEIGRAHV